MANYSQNRKKYERWTKEGRGQGVGRDYKPWLCVQDVPSSGLSHRVPSLKSGRVIHLLSKLEYAAFLLFENNPYVIDIREQYPLSPEVTREIADQNNWPHPRAQDCDYVMTTDLLIDFSVGTFESLAVQVKPTAVIENSVAVQRSMSIERIYWERMQKKFVVFTEENCSSELFNNLDWLTSQNFISTTSEILMNRALFYIELFEKHPGTFVSEIASRANKSLGNSNSGECFAQVRELFSKNYLGFNMMDKSFKTLRGRDVFLNTDFVQCERLS